MVRFSPKEWEYDREIHLSQSAAGWVARDIEAEVVSQGETRTDALENLDEAVVLHRDEIGRTPTVAELRQLGIDPEDNTTGDRRPPDILD